MRGRTRQLAFTEGITAGILFGTAAIFVRFLQGLDALSIAFWRLVIGCLMLAAVLLVLRKAFSFGILKSNIKDLLILSFLLGLHFTFFTLAVKDTTILNATVFVNTSPIFTVFVSAFLFKTEPSRLAVLGLTISFIGICVIAFAETTISVGFSPSLKGDLEAVLAAIVEAFYLNYGRRVRMQMNVVSTMFSIYLFAAITVAIIAVPISNTTPMLPTDLGILLPLIGLGLLPTAIAHTLYFSSLSNLKSFETATMALLEPIGATVLGIIIFKEIPAALFVFGAGLILMGIVFVVKEKI